MNETLNERRGEEEEEEEEEEEMPMFPKMEGEDEKGRYVDLFS